MTATAQDDPAAGDVRARARAFVTEDLWPLEHQVLRRELSPREEPFVPQPGIRYRCDPLGVISPGEYDQLLAAAAARGLAGLEVSRDLGGQALPVTDKLGVVEEMGKTIVPFVLPPDAPNLHWLEAACSAGQRERYLVPYARGELRSGLALTEEAAGSDVAGIRTRATRTAGGWVLDGRKKWIGSADWADFLIVVAVTDEAKGTRGGLTAFLVDRDTPGVVIERRLLTISYQRPCELRLEGVRLGDAQVLGQVGAAFVPLQNRLSLRRLEMAARCVGAADRLLEMMISRARERHTFGAPLADRQIIQEWIADAAMRLHATRLVYTDAASRIAAGAPDVRMPAATAKLMATELLNDVADRCLQVHGALGASKDLPIEHYYRLVRVFRIAEGPSEIQKTFIAREVMRHGSSW